MLATDTYLRIWDVPRLWYKEISSAMYSVGLMSGMPFW